MNTGRTSLGVFIIIVLCGFVLSGTVAGQQVTPPQVIPPPRDLYSMLDVEDPTTLSLTPVGNWEVHPLYPNILMRDYQYFAGRYTGVERAAFDFWWNNWNPTGTPAYKTVDWIVDCTLYIPSGPFNKKYAAIAPATSVHNGSIISVADEYGAETADMFNMAVLIIKENPSYAIYHDEFDYPDENVMVGNSRTVAIYTGNMYAYARWALALSFMRGVTLLEDFNGSTTLNGVVALGCSKRGLGVWTAASVDDRITGIVSAASDSLDLWKAIDHAIADWGDTWPDESTQLKRMLEEGMGAQDFLDHYDIATTFADDVLNQVTDFNAMTISGSSDNGYPILTLGEFIHPGLCPYDDDLVWEYIPGAEHGCGEDEHFADYRTMIAHTFLGEDLPEAAHNQIGNPYYIKIEAEVDPKGHIVDHGDVMLIYTVSTGEYPDFRNTVWQEREMTYRPGTGKYDVRLPKLAGEGFYSLYVEIKYTIQGSGPYPDLEGYTSSIPEIIMGDGSPY